jgi:hypothetical protein
MNVFKKTLLSSAITIVAVMMVNTAQAASFSGSTVGKAIVAESDRSSLAIPSSLTITLGAGEVLSATDSVQFDLAGGATFGTVPANSLTWSGTNAAGVVITDSPDFVLVGQNATQLVYRTTLSTGIPSGAIIKLGSGIQIDASSVAPVTATGTAAEVSLTAKMRGFVGGAAQDLYQSGAFKASLYDFVPTFSASLGSAISGTFDVKTSFTKLTSTTAASTTNLLSSKSTTLSLSVNTAAVKDNNATGIPAAVPNPAKVLVKVTSGSGATMAGIAGITGANFVPANCTTGVATGGASGSFYIPSPTGTEACATLLPTATGAIPASSDLTFLFNGTSQAPQDFKVQARYIADSNYFLANPSKPQAALTVANDIPIATATTVASFGRDGSSFTMNSFGTDNKLKISDLGGIATGASAKISIIAYDASGKKQALVAGKAVTSTTGGALTLAQNATITIDGLTLLAAYPAGTVRFDVFVESPKIKASSVKTILVGGVPYSKATTVYTNQQPDQGGAL